MARMITTIKCDSKAFLETMSNVILKKLKENHGQRQVRIITKIDGCIKYETTGYEIEKTYRKLDKFWKRSARMFHAAGVKVECILE